MLKTSHHLCRFWLCIVGLCFSLLSFGTNASDAIKLADTSSPSATLSSFMHASEQVIQHWRDETLHLPAAQHAYFQVIRTMDLSQLPNRSRTVVVMERILLLREILDRIDLQEHQRAPDAEQVKQKELDMWRFANTDIVLAKQNTADNAGQFLFSSSTVQNLPRWYRILADYSYNTDVRPDYYQEFLLSPGPLFSKSLIESFPNMFKEMYGPLPLWQWLALLGVLSICKVLISFSFYLGERWDEKWQDRGMSWRTGRILSLVGVVLLLLLASYVIDDGIWVTGGVYQFFSISFLLAQFFFLSWLIMAIFNYFAKIYVYNKHQGKHVDSSLIIVLARIFGGMTIAILGVYVVGYMGFSISPIVAGLGVGGLAVALAIRPVLENVINGLTLYADGGIRIGELCRYGDKLGTIESIGLRSTRIRTLERSLITVPNSEFANMEIDNLERRDKRRMEHILRLRSEASLDQLKVLIVNIRRLLLQHPMTEAEPIRVRLMGVGDYSVNINVMAYICCRDNEEFMAIQEDILFAALTQVEQVGAKIAHANQYQLVDPASSHDPKQQNEAAKTVAQWHENDTYPFPDFSFEYKYEIKGSIIYPAQTSAVRQTAMS